MATVKLKLITTRAISQIFKKELRDDHEEVFMSEQTFGGNEFGESNYEGKGRGFCGVPELTGAGEGSREGGDLNGTPGTLSRKVTAEEGQV